MNLATHRTSATRRAFASLLLLSITGCSAGTSTTATTNVTTATVATPSIPNLQPFADPSGTVATYTTAGLIDQTSPFFTALGTNGRTCATCHQPAQGMSLNTTAILALFNSTRGTDPLFAAVDGANCPTAATADATAHSLLLNNGLIRIPITLPVNAQFTLTVLSDPYGCATTLNTAGQQIVAVYRRPLPISALTYLSTVMWDKRETLTALTTASTFNASLASNLTHQLLDAVTIHVQGTTTPTATQIASLLLIEQGLFTAQANDTAAGSLSANGALGGPANLAALTYYPGINDSFGGDPQSRPFKPNVFALYPAWAASTNPQQASISRGEAIFNTAPLNITAVRGINDNPALGNPANLRGSCTTCHDTPNVGNRSLPLPFDTATTRLTVTETHNDILAGLAQINAPSLPVYQIASCKDPAGNPVTFTTTDPGAGLFSGLCADINRVKVPGLRGLAARAPYFHNGSAANLAQVVNFYNARFRMGLNPQQKTDLVNFLSAL